MARSPFRERSTPTISANELAAYMVASDVGREGIIQRARWQPAAPVVRYRDARRAIARFLTDRHRSTQILLDARARLEMLAEDTTGRPFAREDARASIGAIDAFQAGLNSFGFGGMRFETPPQDLSPLDIEGVAVTVSLDLVVRASDRRRGDLVGGILLRLSKGADGESEAASARRRDVGMYATTLVYMACAEQLDGLGMPSPTVCFSVDVQRRERHRASSQYLTREANLRAACRGIQRAWSNVAPPPGA
ncbi:hypothetical protein GXW77_14055 [Roseomonas alkaliterrae]|uniref:Uncharacterized protein n=1 Tax=Neoroseomonas alkaliterrae TaxID=1452450 RepID=A0A840XYL1_9PROT|nr:hypothetical protein [Neoroseomonas alkaliterrae]MBB5691699.1 hypothetical protein [Neoroseomonas alkaliterrae]MBR0677299.1 hypothetical protein [Neoroseomonas alkaliterrae]